MSRKFEVSLEATYTIEFEDAVFDTVDDEWRKVFYNLHTPEEIAAHLGAQLIRGFPLAHIDGWADLPNHYASIIDFGDADCEAWEVKPEDA